jgi:hypothetical protein
MITRRIVVSACALCLAIPAAASASPAIDPPQASGPSAITAPDQPKLVKAEGPYGTTLATHAKLLKAKGPYGTTPATSPRLLEAIGPYGMTAAASPGTLEAKGPFGTTTATSSQDTTTGATAHKAAASTDNGTNDWRTAAISGAALLAAATLGSALFLAGRRRAPRLGT